MILSLLRNCLASFIKNKIKQSKNKAMCYHILVFTVLKEQRMASSQKNPHGSLFHFDKRSTRQLFIFRIEPTYIIETLYFSVLNRVLTFDCRFQIAWIY